MSDLFGKVLGSILSKATAGKSGPSSVDGLNSDALGGLLGGVLGKDGSGLNSVVKRLAASGLSKIVKSWIAKGPNHLITADQITQGLGQDKIAELAKQLGIPQDQVASLLAQHLPDAVDQMTPDGEIVDLTPKD